MIVNIRRHRFLISTGITASVASIATLTTGCGEIQTKGKSAQSHFFMDASDFRESERPAYIRISREIATPEFVRETGFEQDHARGETHAFGWIKSSAFSKSILESDSSRIRDGIQVLDETAMQGSAFDPDTMVEIQQEAAHSPGNKTFEGYHDYQELTAELEALAAANPQLAQLENAGKSVSGRNLWYMKAGSRLDAANGGPRTLLIANMHGDETAGRELMVYLTRELLGGYGRDERITRIMNGSQVFIMPSMNPDGFEDRQRWNTNYKDLNRSFPDFTDDPNDSVNGRPSEVAAVMKMHDRYAFANSLNFHGGTVCYNLPWDTKPNRPANEKFGDDAYVNSLARAYTSTNKTMRDNHGGTFDHGVTYGYEWYEVDGGMQDWSIAYREATHATVELSYAKTVSEGSLETVWNENREAILDFLDRSTLGIHLNAVDDATGAPLGKTEVVTSNSPRSVGFRSGVVHRLTPAGTWKVTVRAAGYTPVNLDVTASRFSGNLQTVRLTRGVATGNLANGDAT